MGGPLLSAFDTRCLHLGSDDIFWKTHKFVYDNFLIYSTSLLLAPFIGNYLQVYGTLLCVTNLP